MTGSLRLRSLLAASVSLVAVTAVAAPAFAQDTTVGEVVVTAQKREEAIQDVPIAVSAFSQDSLEKAKIDGGPNLVLAIPNVNFSKGNFTGYNFQIRGVGSKLVAASGDAGTGIHLNNAPLTANNLFESEFFDMERVEVLRGPQGTLYGRNATGGVVNLITAKPTDDFAASIRGEIGNFGTKKLRGMVNIPMGDMFAVRLAGNWLQRDGYGKNLTTGNDVDNRDLWNTRITVGFNPTDSFNTTLMWDHFEEDDHRSRIGKQYCTKDPGKTSVGGVGLSANPLFAQIQQGYLSQGCLPTKAGSAGSLGTPNSQGTLGGIFGLLTGLTTGDAYAGQMQDPDVRNIQSAFDPTYRAKTDIFQLNVTWDLDDNLQLTSLTGYSKNELFTRQDYNRIVPNKTFNAAPNPVNAIAGNIASQYMSTAQTTTCGAFSTATQPCYWGVYTAQNAAAQAYGQNTYNALYASLFPGGVVNDPQLGPLNRFATADISSGESKQWSQELRLQSNFDGPLNFNVGAIYIDYKNDGDYYVMGNTLTAYAMVNNALLTGTPNCAATNPACTYIDPNQTPDRSGHNYYDNTGAYHLKSRAAFGEVYWQLTDTVRITGGLRYTHDMKRVENRPVALATRGAGIPLSPTTPYLKAEFKETTGRFNIDWKPDLSFTDDTLIYLSYSRGYKAGGVNPACSLGVGCPPPTFAPEFVDAWELGSKNTLLNGAMVVNLTGFSYDYIGYQVSKIVNRTSVNENIDAKIKGLELETIWSPMDGLRLNANIGYLNTKIGSGTSIDTFDRTQGDPSLTMIKAQNASNCVVSTAALAGFMSTFNAGTPVIPAPTQTGGFRALNVFDFLGICDGAFAAFGLTPSDGKAVNLSGKKLPNSPDWTVSIGAQYTWSMGSWDATVRADYYRQTESFSRIYNSAADRLDGWDNANATFTLVNNDWGLTLEAYVKNLMDEEVITDTYLTDDSSGLFRNGFFGEPRTYGVAVTKSF